MKKRLMLAAAMPLAICLFSCHRVDPALNPIGLEEGDGTYDIDETVDNGGGSLHYEIFVRSFCDSDGDGIGDFLGVASKAQYLEDLGVSTVWLMPVNPSPTYHGYDVNDYYAVNPEYGTMEDFEQMLATLKEHGIEVVIDMVLNHSSAMNPWFLQSAQDFASGDVSATSKADWYVWSSQPQTGYYQFPQTGMYYLGNFSFGMPDFNWDSQEFRAEVKDILAFWLQKGVAGYRFDAVRYFYEESMPKNIEAMNYIAECCREVDPDAYLVGENWTYSTDEYFGYYDSGFDSFFDFRCSADYSMTNNSLIRAAKGLSNCYSFAQAVSSQISEVKKRRQTSYPSFFISNHDMNRSSASLYDDYAKSGANLIYLLPGTPYIYYGEEIAMNGIRGNEGTDVARRLPMSWGKGHEDEDPGFPEPGYEYVLEYNEPVSQGVYDQLEDPRSLVNHYRKLGQIRNSIPWIKEATTEAIDLNNRSLCCFRLLGAEGESLLVVVNVSELSIEADVSSLGVEKIYDECDGIDLKARLEGGKLGIPGYSVVVLE